MPTVDFLSVDVARQEVIGFLGSREVVRFPVSTAAKGLGCRKGSSMTPYGEHRVRLKIGAGCPLDAVIYGRRWTGETLDQTLRECFPERDWVLTRALWLQGVEPSTNSGGDTDTLRRFIYFHGTHEEDLIGKAVSFGCVRMRGVDIVDLFERVPPKCRVLIA